VLTSEKKIKIKMKEKSSAQGAYLKTCAPEWRFDSSITSFRKKRNEFIDGRSVHPQSEASSDKQQFII
jgi:hypothetical protein